MGALHVGEHIGVLLCWETTKQLVAPGKAQDAVPGHPPLRAWLFRCRKPLQERAFTRHVPERILNTGTVMQPPMWDSSCNGPCIISMTTIYYLLCTITITNSITITHTITSITVSITSTTSISSTICITGQITELSVTPASRAGVSGGPVGRSTRWPEGLTETWWLLRNLN